MDNQHEKIIGYRDLNENEINLMNEVKLQAQACEELIDKMKGSSLALDNRWLAIGTTDLQTGFSALVRAIAKPTSF
jgi:hypothetical protein